MVMVLTLLAFNNAWGMQSGDCSPLSGLKWIIAVGSVDFQY